MKRPIAVTQPPIAAENPTQATAAQEKNPRRDMSRPAAFGAALGAGLVPAAAGVAVAFAAAAAAAGAGAGAGFPGAWAAGPGGGTTGALVPPATAGAAAAAASEGGALNVSEVAAACLSGIGAVSVFGAPASARAPSVVILGGPDSAEPAGSDAGPSFVSSAMLPLSYCISIRALMSTSFRVPLSSERGQGVSTPHCGEEVNPLQTWKNQRAEATLPASIAA